MLGILLSRNGKRSFVPAVMCAAVNSNIIADLTQYHNDRMGNECTRTGFDDLNESGYTILGSMANHAIDSCSLRLCPDSGRDFTYNRSMLCIER
jgi:hypothetical protein